MTLGGYWPPSSKVEIADFGGGTNCASWRFFGFYFSCVRGTKPFFFAFGRENSPVQPLPLAAKTASWRGTKDGMVPKAKGLSLWGRREGASIGLLSASSSRRIRCFPSSKRFLLSSIGESYASSKHFLLSTISESSLCKSFNKSLRWALLSVPVPF